MVHIINGEKGDGKTKELIKRANECETRGIKVYIGKDNKNIFNLNQDIKYINIVDYDVKTAHGVLSFVRGMIAANSDIEAFFIDGLFDICDEDHSALIDFFEKIGKYTAMFNVEIVLTVSLADEELPDFIKQYKD